MHHQKTQQNVGKFQKKPRITKGIQNSIHKKNRLFKQIYPV